MNTYVALKEKIMEAVSSNLEEAAALSDDLWSNPELSGAEIESSRKIAELLRGQGFEVEHPFAGLDTAFRGVYGSNNHTYKAAVLAEYDALPGIGHACGHNVSGAISVLAALAMKDLQDELDCDIHIIGTPNEENDGAKCSMVDQGVFDEYDEAIMVHLYDQNLLYSTLLGLHQFLYTFHGKAAHGAAAPWEGVNALNAAQLLFHGVDMLRQHVTPDVRIHGVYRNGGLAPNIVPEEASAEFYIRALDKKFHEKLDEQVHKCAEGAALMTGCTWEKEVTTAMYDNMNNNAAGIQAMREVYEELGLPVNGDHDKVFGSSDIGNVSFVCPTFHPTLQLVEKGIPIHTREFAEAARGEKAHECVRKGALVIALHVAKIFSDEERIAAVKADFAK